MAVIQNLPPDRVRISPNFFSSLVSKGSILFLIPGEVTGAKDPQVSDGPGPSPSFQIYLHRLQRQVLRSGYTLSLEQTGQQGMVRYPGTGMYGRSMWVISRV